MTYRTALKPVRPTSSDAPSDSGFPWRREDFGEISALRRVALPAAPFRAVTVAAEPLWIVTRHADVRSSLADRRLSADVHQPGFPLLGQPVQPHAPAPFMRTDAPEHVEVRKALAGHFTMRAIESMRPFVLAEADRLIDEMLARPENRADLVAQFAVPLSMRVILTLIGLPTKDWKSLADLATRYMCASPLTERDQLRVSLRSGQALTEYLDRAVRGCLLDGPVTDGVLTSLLASGGSGEVARTQLVANLFLLVIAGHDTSAGMIAGTVQTLLDHPQHLEELWASPERIPAAIEESLRYLSIVHQMVLRAALEDIDIGGSRITAGEGVALMLYTANHDGSRLPDPDRFDHSRDAGGHLAFGHGMHRCIGQTLARLEMTIAISRLLQRIPTLQAVTGPTGRTFKVTSPIQGLLTLEVAW